MKKIPNPGLGLIWALLIAFPLAALSALVFRFPIPLAGYRSGPSAIPGALFAVVFYGTLGGFVVLAGLGAVSGVMANKMLTPESTEARRLTKVIATALAAVAILILAVLDKIIGPW